MYIRPLESTIYSNRWKHSKLGGRFGDDRCFSISIFRGDSRMRPSRLSRRQFLRLTGTGLALPFLPRPSMASNPGLGPKRLIIFMYPQGTVMNQYLPIGTPDNYTLPYILEPLQPFRDRSLIITGVDNLSPLLNPVGNAHYNANFSFLTARPFYVQDSAALECWRSQYRTDYCQSHRYGYTIPKSRLCEWAVE